MPGQPKKQRERERVNPAYGYIATTIRLRSRLLSSTELGTEQLGSQWDHISTTAPVGRNKMASAIRLLFQIPRRRAQSLVSFFFSFFFFFLFPFLDLTNCTTNFSSNRTPPHPPPSRISSSSSWIQIRQRKIETKEEYPFAIFFFSLFSLIYDGLRAAQRAFNQ